MAEGKVTLKFSFKGAIESIVFYGNIACNALVASLQRKFGAGIDPSYLIIDGEEVLLNDDAIRLVLVKNQSKIYGIPELRGMTISFSPSSCQPNVLPFSHSHSHTSPARSCRSRSTCSRPR